MGPRLCGDERRYGIAGIACMVLWALLGTTSPGTACGATTTAIASTSRTAAVPHVTARRHGMVFSSAISAATSAIQERLMTPRANSAAISAQQQPKHQP